jgi:16S rRNA processing protein RimM
MDTPVSDRVCIGVIVGVHGVRGAVRIKSFTEVPADVAAYGPVEDDAGKRRFRPRLLGESKGVVLAQLEGVADRDAAMMLKGVKLWVAKSALPALEEEEFFYSDLVGMAAALTDGTALGRVKGVFDFGGGDIIEISGPKGEMMLPFTRAVVPEIDLARRRLVVELPHEIEARPEDETGGGEDGVDGDE